MRSTSGSRSGSRSGSPSSGRADPCSPRSRSSTARERRLQRHGHEPTLARAASPGTTSRPPGSPATILNEGLTTVEVAVVLARGHASSTRDAGMRDAVSFHVQDPARGRLGAWRSSPGSGRASSGRCSSGRPRRAERTAGRRDRARPQRGPARRAGDPERRGLLRPDLRRRPHVDGRDVGHPPRALDRARPPGRPPRRATRASRTACSSRSSAPRRGRCASTATSSTTRPGSRSSRSRSRAGEFDGVFRIQANVLHCDSLDTEQRVATGWLSPPSRPVTALFNLDAAESWKAGAERLEGGEIRFKDGFDWKSIDPLHERYAWDDSPLRYLHLCFLRRSSLDPETPEEPRLTLSESGDTPSRSRRDADEGGAPSPRQPADRGRPRARLELEAREVPAGAARRDGRLALPRRMSWSPATGLVSVVVVTYEWPEALDLTLRALADQDDPRVRGRRRRRRLRARDRRGRRALAGGLRRPAAARLAAGRGLAAGTQPQPRRARGARRLPRVPRRGLSRPQRASCGPCAGRRCPGGFSRRSASI